MYYSDILYPRFLIQSIRHIIFRDSKQVTLTADDLDKIKYNLNLLEHCVEYEKIIDGFAQANLGQFVARLMSENHDKVLQTENKPNLRGWFIAKATLEAEAVFPIEKIQEIVHKALHKYIDTHKNKEFIKMKTFLEERRNG